MSTDTKIKTLIFNKLTQEQYNNADRVPTEFYLTPDTSIDSSEKGAANGVATLDSNGKVTTEQIPVATTSTLGVVKPDGTTITATADGVISAVGGSGSGSGFDFEGTKAEFDAAVAAGTITEDSVSLITDDVSGDNVATKADLESLQTEINSLNTEVSKMLGRPNYNAGVNITLETTKFGTGRTATYTVPSDGVIWVGEVSDKNVVYINNMSLGGGSSDSASKLIRTLIPVSAGDILKLSTSDTAGSFVGFFAPNL